MSFTFEKISDTYKVLGSPTKEKRNSLTQKLREKMKEAKGDKEMFSKLYLAAGILTLCKGKVKRGVEYLEKSKKAKMTTQVQRYLILMQKYRRGMAEAHDFVRKNQLMFAVEGMKKICKKMKGFYAIQSSIRGNMIEVLRQVGDESVKKTIMELCDRILMHDPDHINTLRIRSKAYTLINEFDKAVEDLARLHRLEPENPKFLEMLNKYQLKSKSKKPTDFYKLLGVLQSAKEEEIKEVIKKRQRKCHPDRFQDEFEKKKAEEEFTLLGIAKETLLSYTKRQKYDEALNDDSVPSSHFTGGTGQSNTKEQDSYGWETNNPNSFGAGFNSKTGPGNSRPGMADEGGSGEGWSNTGEWGEGKAGKGTGWFSGNKGTGQQGKPSAWGSFKEKKQDGGGPSWESNTGWGNNNNGGGGFGSQSGGDYQGGGEEDGGDVNMGMNDEGEEEQTGFGNMDGKKTPPPPKSEWGRDMPEGSKWEDDIDDKKKGGEEEEEEEEEEDDFGPNDEKKEKTNRGRGGDPRSDQEPTTTSSSKRGKVGEDGWESFENDDHVYINPVDLQAELEWQALFMNDREVMPSGAHQFIQLENKKTVRDFINIDQKVIDEAAALEHIHW